MNKKTSYLQLPEDRVERVSFYIFMLLLIFVATAFILYPLLAPNLIESAYNGESFNFLSRLIQYQHNKPLEHYQNLGESIFSRIVICICLAGSTIYGLCMIIYRLFFSTKPIRITWVILTAMIALAGIYFLNPYFRVFSNHGFLRASIVYQILNGNVPPQDPFFEGQILRWPWGFAWLIAMFSQLSNLSPFTLFAFINIFSLSLSLFLIYKTSELLTPDRKANIFSAIISILGITIFNKSLILNIADLLHLPLRETRATPAFIKFSDANGVPLGLMFFFLFVYAVIRLFKDRNIVLPTIFLLVSILGCSFIYTPFAPGILVSTAMICILCFIPWIPKSFRLPPRPCLILILTCLITTAILWPYFRLIHSGMGQNAQILQLSHAFRNLAVYVFLAFPILSLIFLTRRSILKNTDRNSLFLLSCIIMGNAGAYLTIYFPLHAEYKFLLLSCATLGILGGLAFRELRQKIPQVVILFLFLCFLFPSFSNGYTTIRRFGNHPIFSAPQSPRFREQGIYLKAIDPQEDELYQWIQKNTSVDSVFVDTEWLIPVYAQRGLLLGMDTPDDSKRTGYNVDIDFLKVSQRYNDDEFSFRRKLVRTLYGFENTLPRMEILEYLSGMDIYIVVRPSQKSRNFDSIGLKQIFQTSTGDFQIYQPDITLDK